MKQKVLVIYGATASGKTSLALSLADFLDIEIISADSRQIFQEMNIGTAKPTMKELAKVPHHFIGEIPILQSYDAGNFVKQAKERINQIIDRKKTPIVVGGSTLYLKGLLHGFSELPPSNIEIRKTIQEDLLHLGNKQMYNRLMTIDPIHAKTLDATKINRLIRSLELIEIIGEPLSEYYKKNPVQKNDQFNFVPVYLNINRNILYDRINQRVDTMITAGWIKESENLFEKYYSFIKKGNVQSLNTIGYKEMFDFFQNKHTFECMVELIKKKTRNYAKRQITFFTHQFKDDCLLIHSMDTPVKEKIKKIFLNEV